MGQVRDVAVMLLLRTSHRAAGTFCALEATNDILEEAPETTKVVREEKSGTSEKLACVWNKRVLVCVYRIKKKPATRMLLYRLCTVCDHWLKSVHRCFILAKS